ncbi:DEAD/DEAH box helicase [Fructilactobacillus carniphilus]|uniref:DEAD-box ATP-dependent RNA helicase CshB n=1 Tax=Fructilactobacillus carniphilus TaxID=2940297 RepID=A0ABY5BZM4_9LACO|nr:DEAD/DEAH box helicase [Fructilactobacillus carniphilus]USS91244.1 DEAD/DEAH box helicase [Fructilactobacillus carniphilus]
MSASFTDYHFQPFIMEALQELDFKKPTPIQAQVIPTIQHGNSIVGKSATGSGKTHAFLLPLFDQLDPADHRPQVIITTPSRELSYQIYENIKQLVRHSSSVIHVENYVGGTDKERQLEKLDREQPQVVVGTPGRILDIVKSGKLEINAARRLVIDEADMTLDLGFLTEVDQIAARMAKDLQMMVFSATIPPKLKPFLQKYLKNPVITDIPTEHVINADVSNWLISTKGQDKNRLIFQLLTMGNPYLALVFANTRGRADELEKYLQEQGLKVAKLHGGMQPRVRKRVMKQIQNLDFQYVVATDLAARGIDITGVSLVINDDLPSDSEYFVHRVGRTGRNGMPGTAITLYAPDEEAKIAELEAKGVQFQPKEIKHGEVVDTYDRRRRQQYRGHHDQLDGSTLGMIKKKKKHVKPGYKKKIKRAIKIKDDQNRKIELRQQVRAKKKQKKRSSQRYQ